MRETIKIAGRLTVVQKLLQARWPDGAWIVFSGGDEASGSTRENAIYNFERMLACSLSLHSPQSVLSSQNIGKSLSEEWKSLSKNPEQSADERRTGAVVTSQERNSP